MSVPGEKDAVPVRLRLGDRKVLIIQAPAPSEWCGTGPPAPGVSQGGPPVTGPPGHSEGRSAPVEPAHVGERGPGAGSVRESGSRGAGPARMRSAIIAIVEAVPSRGDELAQAALQVAEAEGLRCGLLSLEPQNRLAGRFGCTVRTPIWQWQQGAPELLVAQGSRTLVAAPEAEEGLDGKAVAAVLERLTGMVDVAVVDLGCRWLPRLFRPVLTAASHIWVLTRAGQWSGAEMRLEQAELSGWTDMSRVRLVILGDAPVPVQYQAMVAGVLPDVVGRPALDFVWRELGRELT